MVLSCKEPHDSKSVSNQSSILDSLIANEKTPGDEETTEFNWDSVNVDPLEYPNDSTPTSAYILSEGLFHGDEVIPEADKEKWIGLFYNNNKFWLAETKVQATKTFDGILDEEGDSTGIKIKILSKDSCAFVLSGIYNLPLKPVQTVQLSKNIFYPNDSVTFDFKNIKYKITTTGEREGEYFWNYKIYLTITTGNSNTTQLLLASSTLNYMAENFFVADINNDGILDFVFDTSLSENMSRPTLYLSQKKGNEYIMKIVAFHTTTGC